VAENGSICNIGRLRSIGSVLDRPLFYFCTVSKHPTRKHTTAMFWNGGDQHAYR